MRKAVAAVLLTFAAVASAQQPMPMQAQPVMVQPAASTSDRSISVLSPYRTLDRTRRLINELATYLAIVSGYRENTDGAGAWKTRDLDGLVISRRFEKQATDGTRMTIEVAVVPTAAGEFRIHVFGNQGPNANPDLAAVKTQIDSLVAGQQPVPASGPPGRENIRQHMYQLSYVQADRALAVLKALGYATVEFSQSPGETKYDTVFEPVRKGEMSLPVIVKLIDSAKTSLMDPFVNPTPMQPQMMAPPQYGQQTRQPIPDIGGTFLHQITTGEPQERLMILYDETNTDALERVIEVLNRTIDVPARQVVISALIVEVNSNRLRELGISFKDTNGRVSGTLPDENVTNPTPFTFVFDQLLPRGPFRLQATLEALVQKGEAEILSNPSVLVLDGRQARIQIGQQVPVVNSTATAAGITSSVDYFPVGIVLNLRPRISDDGNDVTMQVETIVSAVASTAPVGTGVFFAPTVDNRQVQTFVRVADSTPFIIGGLISSNNQRRRAGIPLLSELPYVGSLFRTTRNSRDKREVIVVLTPHVVPIAERNFSYVIPKDSDTFDSFGNRLFRNAYRIRSRDVFDLRFIYESDAFQRLLSRVRAQAALSPGMSRDATFAPLLRGEVPGEAILVRRMLWEIIRKTEFTKHLENERIIFFQPTANDPTSTDFVLSFFKDHIQKVRGSNALILSFDAVNRGTPEHPFAQPKATLTWESVPKSAYEKRLIELNARDAAGRPRQWSIILSEDAPGSASPLEVLKGVLILKRLLALNTTLPLTLKDFRVGRQIIFPTEEDIQQGFHVIDHDTAQLFYEVMQYYRAFEQEFNAQTRSLTTRIDAMK